MDPAIIETLASHFGAPGVMAGVFIWLYVKKDGELRQERAARTTDAAKTLDLVMKVKDQTNDNISRLGTIADEMRRQREEARR